MYVKSDTVHVLCVSSSITIGSTRILILPRKISLKIETFTSCTVISYTFHLNALCDRVKC